jgi:hypothetical protein
VAASPSAALQDLRPLVLGDHPLHLQQEVVLRRAADGPVQEDHLDAGAAELFHQQRLVGVAAGEPVGGLHIEPLDGPGRHHVAQPLQRRADEGGAAEALIGIGMIGLELSAIGSDPLA